MTQQHPMPRLRAGHGFELAKRFVRAEPGAEIAEV